MKQKSKTQITNIKDLQIEKYKVKLEAAYLERDLKALWNEKWGERNSLAESYGFGFIGSISKWFAYIKIAVKGYRWMRNLLISKKTI
ncbi:MAG: hypothetical protein Q4F97_01080 [Bacteroidales bacterium]|nr:hypothetical protein [Bacteroidales bacterium]